MPEADKMGLMHSLSLCVLGRLYRCASLEPLGHSAMICAMQIMSGSLPDTYINA